MPFKSAEQPLCRWCAKPIRKSTVTVYVKQTPSVNDKPHLGFSRYAYADKMPATKQECQRLTNLHVVSVKRYQPVVNTGLNYGEKTGDSYIDQFGEWDGESYADPFFCSSACAQQMGYAACEKHSICTKRYQDAIKAKGA
jgi:hypothetical protein